MVSPIPHISRSLSPSPNLRLPALGLTPVAQTTVPVANQPKERPHRGRKKRQLTEEQRKSEAARRVERNREIARDNRVKYKVYMKSLEERVKSLTRELETCKGRLAEYDVLAQGSYTDLLRFFTRVKDDMRGFERKRLDRTAALMIGRRQKDPSVMPAVSEKTEDKRKALNLIAETLIESAVPLGQRYLLCLAERIGSDNERRSEPIDQMLRYDETALNAIPGVCKYLKEASARLRMSMRQYLQSFEAIRDQAIALDLYVMEQVAPLSEPTRLGESMKWVQQVVDASGQFRMFGEERSSLAMNILNWPHIAVHESALALPRPVSVAMPGVQMQMQSQARGDADDQEGKERGMRCGL